MRYSEITNFLRCQQQQTYCRLSKVKRSRFAVMEKAPPPIKDTGTNWRAYHFLFRYAISDDFACARCVRKIFIFPILKFAIGIKNERLSLYEKKIRIGYSKGTEFFHSQWKIFLAKLTSKSLRKMEMEILGHFEHVRRWTIISPYEKI